MGMGRDAVTGGGGGHQEEVLCYLGLPSKLNNNIQFPMLHKIKLGDIECSAFLDSGCHKSIISERLFNRISPKF